MADPHRGHLSTRRIGRLAFLWWLLPVTAVSIAATVAFRFARGLVGHQNLMAIGISVVAFGVVLAAVFVFFQRAVFPRLRDLGLYGPFRIGVAALLFIPALQALVLLALLFAPSNAVQEAPSQ